MKRKRKSKPKREMIGCVCDACGKRKKCPKEAAGPKGWFFLPISLEGVASFELGGSKEHLSESAHVVCALACSKECCDEMRWRKT